MRHMLRVAAFIAILAVCITGAYAQNFNDQAALAGIKEIKVAWDLVDGDGNTLLKQLTLINEARQSLVDQGVKPRMVLVFRGQATKLVQSDLSQIKPENLKYAARIAEQIKILSSAEGVSGIEQCETAVRLIGTKAENVLPGIKVVGHGWISLMAYQAKGYSYIAP
jgi:intracellular sulfur oxidation DsrE/DsrF family protein